MPAYLFNIIVVIYLFIYVYTLNLPIPQNLKPLHADESLTQKSQALKPLHPNLKPWPKNPKPSTPYIPTSSPNPETPRSPEPSNRPNPPKPRTHKHSTWRPEAPLRPNTKTFEHRTQGPLIQETLHP